MIAIWLLMFYDRMSCENNVNHEIGATSSLIIFVGVRGFEPPTSSSRTTRANRAALHPEIDTKSKIISLPVICLYEVFNEHKSAKKQNSKNNSKCIEVFIDETTDRISIFPD